MKLRYGKRERVYYYRREGGERRKGEGSSTEPPIPTLYLSLTLSKRKEKRIASQGDKSNKPRQSQTESSWTQNSGSRTERKDGRLSGFGISRATY
jgi:hypothetical protein